MEGDDIIQRQVSKFQKISCNGSSVISDTSSNPNKIGNRLFPVGDGGGSGGDGGGGVGRLVGWPSSRIVRVSRASGGKDRHSKVLTSKGLRDRRIRLSVSTAIEFYDLQDRLGYDQPSKAVEWLIKAASSSIDELPSLDPSFSGGGCSTGGTDNHHQERQLIADNINNINNINKSVEHDTDFEDPNHQHHHQNNNNNSNSNSNNNNACSSTSDTSKGSGLSLSRSENRIRARERARDLAAKKEKVKESTMSSSSFTDLLTGGININNNLNPQMDYFQMPQFNNIPNQHQPQNHHYAFLQGNYAPGSGGLASSGLNRGTLQSNLLSSIPHHHQQHNNDNNNNIQRTFQQATMVDGSASANFPFFMAPTISSGGPDHHFQVAGYDSQRLQLYGGVRHSDHYKEKSKN